MSCQHETEKIAGIVKKADDTDLEAGNSEVFLKPAFKLFTQTGSRSLALCALS